MNSKLYNRTYKVPVEILSHIKSTLIANPKNDGIRRAKNILKSGVITYQNLKRLKNFFDYFNKQDGDKIQYQLAGGNPMKSFVEKTLNGDRDVVSRSKDIRRDVTHNHKSELKPYKANPRLDENVDENIRGNALAVIVNDDGKILLLRRSECDGCWGSGQWALVGGGVEDGESPEEACTREIFEETGLEIDQLSKGFLIQRNTNSVEYVFKCQYDVDDMDVELVV
jgi:hypothetical protein